MKRLSYFAIAVCLLAAASTAPAAKINPHGRPSSVSLPGAGARTAHSAAFADSFFNDLHIGALWFPSISNKGYIGYYDLTAFYPGGGEQSGLWEAGMWAGGYVEGQTLPWRFFGSKGHNSDSYLYDTLDEQAVVLNEDDLGLPYPYRRLTVHVNTANKPDLIIGPDSLDGDMGLDVAFEYNQWGVPGYDHWIFVHATVAFTKPVDDFWWGWMSDFDVGDVDVPDFYFDDYAGWDETYEFCYMRDWDYDPLPGDTLWLSPNVIGQTLLAAPPAGGPVTAPPDNNQRWETKNYWDWNNDVSSVQDFYDRLSGAWLNPFPPDSAFDYKILNGVGPYDASPGDTAHFWMAYVLGEGYDEDSRSMYGMGNLVDHVADAHAFYDGGMVIPAGSIPPRAPDLAPDLPGDIMDDDLLVHWAPYNDIAGGAAADSFIVYADTTGKLGPWTRVAAFDNTGTDMWLQLTRGSCTYVWVQAWDNDNGLGSNPYALTSRLYETDANGVLRANQNTITCAYLNPISAVLFRDVRARYLGSSVEVAWDVVVDEEIKGFKLYRREHGTSGGEITCSEGLISSLRRKYTDDGIVIGKTYDYVLSAVRKDGSEVRARTATVKTTARKLTLYQNHPNPFNPKTTISFDLPSSARVVLSIYDVEGKLVRKVADAVMGEGHRSVTWDGKDERGGSVGSGVYFYRLKSGKRTLTRKMVLLK